jgi:hypothetical protein
MRNSSVSETKIHTKEDKRIGLADNIEFFLDLGKPTE